MKRSLAALVAALLCTIGTIPTASARTVHEPPAPDPTWDCNADPGGLCVNDGSSAHGFVEGCYAPKNVIVAFAYYGHVFGLFTDPDSVMTHFFYGGAPFWTVAYFDDEDSRNGFRVYWRMGGPKQRYPGQRHLIYEVNAYCEDPDGPHAPPDQELARDLVGGRV